MKKVNIRAQEAQIEADDKQTLKENVRCPNGCPKGSVELTTETVYFKSNGRVLHMGNVPEYLLREIPKENRVEELLVTKVNIDGKMYAVCEIEEFKTPFDAFLFHQTKLNRALVSLREEEDNTMEFNTPEEYKREPE